jgi:hypothetical protein
MGARSSLTADPRVRPVESLGGTFFLVLPAAPREPLEVALFVVGRRHDASFDQQVRRDLQRAVRGQDFGEHIRGNVAKGR